MILTMNIWRGNRLVLEVRARLCVFLELSDVRSEGTYAKDRVKTARLKLTGINPTVITASVLWNFQDRQDAPMHLGRT